MLILGFLLNRRFDSDCEDWVWLSAEISGKKVFVSWEHFFQSNFWRLDALGAMKGGGKDRG
jgi:hypothetical protein